MNSAQSAFAKPASPLRKPARNVFKIGAPRLLEKVCCVSVWVCGEN